MYCVIVAAGFNYLRLESEKKKISFRLLKLVTESARFLKIAIPIVYSKAVD